MRKSADTSLLQLFSTLFVGVADGRAVRPSDRRITYSRGRVFEAHRSNQCSIALNCILFSFLYKLTVLTGLCKPVVRNLLFRNFCLNDYAGNAFYANEKEPRVRPRFPLVELRGFEPLTYALRTHRSTN